MVGGLSIVDFRLSIEHAMALGSQARFAVVNRHLAIGNFNYSMFRFSRRIPTSLSPRPEIFTSTTSAFFIRGARLESDHAMKIPHHGGIGMRAQHASQ